MGRRGHALTGAILALLVIEFLDELVYGAREAAWPLLRSDLTLTYVQVGVLLSAPTLIGNIVEPVFGVLSDVWRRRVLILGGGVVFALALGLTALSGGFVALLVAFILLSPASGLFVGLSQAALMDADPDRREQNMARWTFAGSLGVMVGPLALSAALALGFGWRGLFGAFAVLSVLVLAGAGRGLSNGPTGDEPSTLSAQSVRDGLANAARAVRQKAVLRWLVLLQLSDLMLDVFYSFLALYLVDVARVAPEQAGLAVTVWTVCNLLGDFLLLPVLERVHGLWLLRLSAVLMLGLYPAFLLAGPLALKLVLLGAQGLLNAGWYAILKAQLYAALPDQSGTALAAYNVAGLVGGLIPLVLGIVAQRAGLDVAMWLLLAGPLALVIGIPSQANARRAER